MRLVWKKKWINITSIPWYKVLEKQFLHIMNKIIALPSVESTLEGNISNLGELNYH